jgi:phage N-6-adenine-methyltransferase
MNVHFSSQSDDWETPQNLFDSINVMHGPFNLDVCASIANAKCSNFFTVKENGLNQPWTGICWMNPPYGKTIGMWMQKAYSESQNGVKVVCLVPARTDTAWWHKWAMKGEITFLRGRVKFGGHKNSAPFPSAIVVFQPTMAKL